MPTTSEPDDHLLMEYKEAYIRSHVPVVVYAIIVNLCGIVGNIATMIYYGRIARARKAPTQFFIMTLSINDLMSCICTGINGPMMDLSPMGLYNNAVECRFNVFVVKAFSINSLFILVLIGFDRYLRVCRPFSKLNFTLKKAICCLFAETFFSIIYASRDFVTYDFVKRNYTIRANQTIVVDRCFPSKTKNNHDFFVASQVIDNITLAATVIMLIVQYTLIWRKIVKQRRRTRGTATVKTVKKPHSVDRPTKRISVSSVENTSETKLNSDRNTDDNTETPKEEPKLPDSVHIDREIMHTDGDVAQSVSNIKRNKQTHNKQKMPKQRNSTNKITFTMFMTTAASLLSFLPYMIVVALFPRGEEKSPIVMILYRSYMLNSSMNPYIIGFINRDFRQFLRRGISNLCHWKRK